MSDNNNLGASASGTALSSLRDQAPAGLAPDGLQSTDAAHTPGPWSSDKTISVRGDAVSLAWLCSTDPGSASDVEARANARLIAAAPELLEALSALTNFVDLTCAYVDADPLLDAARAAIAKATGAA